MAESTGQSTRVSILMALRNDPRDQSAWSAFVDRYGPQIHAWCLRWKLQEADAQDVTQMVLVKLVRQLPNFTYAVISTKNCTVAAAGAPAPSLRRPDLTTERF